MLGRIYYARPSFRIMFRNVLFLTAALSSPLGRFALVLRQISAEYSAAHIKVAFAFVFRVARGV